MVIVASIVLPSLITGLEIALGSRMRLLIDEVSFGEAFSRFPNDEVNGLSPDKLKRLGQEAEILEVYSDGTVTCRFDDGVRHDMPIEAFSPVGHTAAAETVQYNSVKEEPIITWRKPSLIQTLMLLCHWRLW